MKNYLSRRSFIQKSAWFAGAATALPLLHSLGSETSSSAPAAALSLDASERPPAAETAGFHMGTATAPGGHTLTVNSRNLLRDGQPWLPISGEFHFARCPETEWQDELLKMKAGGVSIVATYIFWIHHEEVEGQWDWSGRRNLRAFLESCRKADLNVLLRIGPWCHGEVRNGGFPDWLQKKGDAHEFELRRDNPGYLGYVKKLYEQISQQMNGLQWKDGGPVIAIQLENEYSGPNQHLMTLKQMAREAGMDLPLYTCTGWGGGDAAPYGEILPFSGAYADGFWDRSTKAMLGGYPGVFRFFSPRNRNAAAMGAVGAAAAGAAPKSASAYPVFTCELGGGMTPSYHRRVFMFPQDTESLALCRLGSGANLLGFYMYHGGENPDGKLTYLNETQATNYWNDLPVKNYDFQAPIGEFGQERQHYHWLRLLGLFLQEFGPGLAGMTPRMPAVSGPLNWAMRSDGQSGYLFVSNYQRLLPQPKLENVQFQIELAGGELIVPSTPVTVPDDCRFFWPLNLDLGGLKLIYATAQPICHVDDRNTRTTVFKQTARILAEFVFDGKTAKLDSSTGESVLENERIHLRNLRPGLGAAIRLEGKDGKQHVILLLDEDTSLTLWKGQWLGQERLFLTRAALLLDGPALRLRTEDPADCSIGILPAPRNLTDGHGKLEAKEDGLFRRFTPRLKPVATLRATVEPLQPAGPARTVPIAPSIPGRQQGMAMQPTDADFEQAAVWRVRLPAGVDPSRDLRLRVRYTGDVARAYLGGKLIADDFYHARPFEIGLRRFGAAAYQQELLLKILPLREDAPVYVQDRSGLQFNAAHTALTLDGIDGIETHEARLEGENQEVLDRSEILGKSSFMG
ncbi:MAG: beta-galactosidase [Terracidiphilus sp.]